MQRCANSGIRDAFLLFAVLLLAASGVAQESGKVSAPDPITIIQSMERVQSEVQLPRRVTREYRFGASPKLSANPDVVAEVDFTPPGRYTVRGLSGNSRAGQVVRRLLEHELEIAGSIQKSQSTAVTSENYGFSYLGKTVLNGDPCYLFQITAKRKQPELISGRAWIDQKTFLIRRMEGELAKSPSWWVKSVRVDLSFTNSQSTWLQSSMEAVAEVRCLGPQKLTSRVVSYETAPLAAKNIDGLTIPSSSYAGH